MQPAKCFRAFFLTNVATAEDGLRSFGQGFIAAKWAFSRKIRLHWVKLRQKTAGRFGAYKHTPTNAAIAEILPQNHM